MDQIKFIQMSNNIQPMGPIVHQPNGIILVNLRPQIQVTHNYKKKNEMQVIFIDDQSRYLIPSQKELEDIYKMHLGNTNLTEILHKYCEEKLKKI